MKRKDVKKSISFVCGELMAECVAILQYKKEVNVEDVQNIMLGIIRLQNDLISRCSHVEPGATKLFFKKLRKDLIDTTDEIVEQINAIA